MRKPTEIHSTAVNHFQNMFSVPSANNHVRNFRAVVDKQLAPSKSAELISQVTDEEIKATIFRMTLIRLLDPTGILLVSFKRLGISLVVMFVPQ